MVGVEYILLHAQEPILYIIRKQQRQSPSQGQWHLKNLVVVFWSVSGQHPQHVYNISQVSAVVIVTINTLLYILLKLKGKYFNGVLVVHLVTGVLCIII